MQGERVSGKSIGIIGGGLMGLALARRLSLDGHRVTVIEQGSQPGGLATWHDFGDFVWDRFYHVILPSDRELIQFVRDLGLESELEWRRTYTGFFVDEDLHSISSNYEFLRFPLLSIFSKARLAWTMLYASRIDDWRRLESQTAEEWLMRVSGRETYEKLWQPLLLAKLGENYRRVSAVFIWAYIKRLFSARDSAASAEHLGHVKGGYRQIFNELVRLIESNRGHVECDRTVLEISAGAGNRVSVHCEDGAREFDGVVFTGPDSVLRKLVDPALLDVQGEAQELEYLGVVCVTIISERPLVPFYVVNIADDNVPFTGLIGMSNVLAPESVNGLHLTYLPKYILSTDPELRLDDEYFQREFLTGLRRIVPDLDAAGIRSVHVNRAFKVQPLQVLHYSSLVPRIETTHPGLYVLNTSQFVDGTLNNNEVIGAVNKFYEKYADRLAA